MTKRETETDHATCDACRNGPHPALHGMLVMYTNTRCFNQAVSVTRKYNSTLQYPRWAVSHCADEATTVGSTCLFMCRL